MDVLFNQLCPNTSACEGFWENDPSSTIFGEAELIRKRTAWQELGKQLKGMELKIATLQNFPLSYRVLINGTWEGMGVAFDFIKYLKDKYEFNYTVVAPSEEILGTNETGIFGMLHNGEADVAAAFLPVIPTYWTYVRYSPSLDLGEWVVLMKRPAESATGSGLLAPFTWDVWLLILVSLLCVGPVIYYLIRLHKKLCAEEPSTEASISACMWFVYGALLKQGSTVVPISDSTRFLFATWWIFITILTAFYTANLTAFLTLSQFTLPVSTSNDIGSKRYHWVTKRGNAIQEASSNQLESLYYSMKGSSPLYVMDDNDIILNNYVRKQGYLYIGEKPIVEHMMFNDYLDKARSGILESERCTYVMTTWAVLLRARAFAYSQKFPFHELFDDTLEHLVEAGIVKYKLRDGLPNTQICPLNLGSKERQLRNTDLLLTYYIVSGGFVVAALVFIIEIIVKIIMNSDSEEAVHEKGKESSGFVAPPPPYHSLFRAPFNYANSEKKNINGRDYWVVQSPEGEKIVPMRAPSALLFQYTH